MRNSRRILSTLNKHVLRNRTGVDPQLWERSIKGRTALLPESSFKFKLHTRTWMLWSAGRNEVKTTFSLNATSEYKIVGVWTDWRLDWMAYQKNSVALLHLEHKISVVPCPRTFAQEWIIIFFFLGRAGVSNRLDYPEKGSRKRHLNRILLGLKWEYNR
jgi:hypothetical protein